jgi:hypothetical protein
VLPAAQIAAKNSDPQSLIGAMDLGTDAHAAGRGTLGPASASPPNPGKGVWGKGAPLASILTAGGEGQARALSKEGQRVDKGGVCEDDGVGAASSDGLLLGADPPAPNKSDGMHYAQFIGTGHEACANEDEAIVGVPLLEISAQASVYSSALSAGVSYDLKQQERGCGSSASSAHTHTHTHTRTRTHARTHTHTHIKPLVHAQRVVRFRVPLAGGRQPEAGATQAGGGVGGGEAGARSEAGGEEERRRSLGMPTQISSM